MMLNRISKKIVQISKDKVTDDNKSMLVEAYVYLGYYWAAKNDMVQAKAIVNEGLKLDPTNKPSLDLLAKLGN